MKVKIDAETCVGCGLCADSCPEVFQMQDDKAVVKTENVPAAAEENCKKTAEDCPVTAISIE